MVRGGLALPDYKYFLAAQLVTAHWWLQPDLTNPAIMLEAAIVKSLRPYRSCCLGAKKLLTTLLPP